MGLVKEFREFAMRGNVVDLAVGVIIGAAFGRIVNSLVEDIVMPPIGKVIGNMDFTNLYVPLYSLPAGASEYPKTLMDAKKLGSVVAYGNFLTIAINFVIVAFCIFLIIKLMNVAQRRWAKEKEKEPAPPAPPTKEQELLAEIRDLLKQRQPV
jgi:large conductance mechanosensitive channel